MRASLQVPNSSALRHETIPKRVLSAAELTIPLAKGKATNARSLRRAAEELRYVFPSPCCHCVYLMLRPTCETQSAMCSGILHRLNAPAHVAPSRLFSTRRCVLPQITHMINRLVVFTLYKSFVTRGSISMWCFRFDHRRTPSLPLFEPY